MIICPHCLQVMFESEREYIGTGEYGDEYRVNYVYVNPLDISIVNTNINRGCGREIEVIEVKLDEFVM